jgi:hypothetical protein
MKLYGTNKEQASNTILALCCCIEGRQKAVHIHVYSFCKNSQPRKLLIWLTILNFTVTVFNHSTLCMALLTKYIEL